jgi:hypothetical protein
MGRESACQNSAVDTEKWAPRESLRAIQIYQLYRVRLHKVKSFVRPTLSIEALADLNAASESAAATSFSRHILFTAAARVCNKSFFFGNIALVKNACLALFDDELCSSKLVFTDTHQVLCIFWI